MESKEYKSALPFYPEKTKMINSYVGFCLTGDTVHYFKHGESFYFHDKASRNGYRFALALLKNNACSTKELMLAFGESRRNIERYAKSYRDHGADYFFWRKETRGQCYKMTPELLSAIQNDLDNDLSIYRIALNRGISESAVSYHIKNGNLKKKSNQKAQV